MSISYVSATGTNDHTVINNAISAASSGDTVYLYDGSYDIAGIVNLADGITLQGQSKDGVVFEKANANTTSCVYLNTLSNCTVKDLTIDGNGTTHTTATSNGLQVRRGSGHTIQNVHVKDCRGHSVMIYGTRNCAVTSVTTSNSATTQSGTSHGLDIDGHDFSLAFANLACSIGTTTCTATVGASHGLVVGDWVFVAGCTQSEYNGAFEITNIGATTVDYELGSNSTANNPSGTTLEWVHSCHTVAVSDCTLQNATVLKTGQSTKFEACRGVTFTDCTFNTELVWGDDVSSTAAEATFTDCTIDGVFIFALRSSDAALTIDSCTFTHDGGCIGVFDDNNATPVISNCTFNGANTIYGYDDTNFTTVTNYTWTNNTHTVKRPKRASDITMFASMVDTGSATYSDTTYNRPYTTPNTAHNDVVALSRINALYVDGITIALLSGYGTQDFGTGSTPIGPITTAVQWHLEGYPGTVTLDCTTATGDAINYDSNSKAGSSVRNIVFLNTGAVVQNTGYQAIRCSPALGVTIENCRVTNWVSGYAGSGIEFSGASVFNVINCEFDNILASATTDGTAILVQGTSTGTIQGCKFHDNACRTGVVRCSNTGIGVVDIVGCEFTNNTSTGSSAGMYLQDTDITVKNCTFYGNVAVTSQGGAIRHDVYATAEVTFTNCIIPVNDNIYTTSVTKHTVAGCLISDGVGGVHTDGGNNVTGTPTYTDAANDDFSLTAASSGVGVGVSSTTFAAAATGGSIPGYDIDIGANQSSHGPFHPVNL